MLQSEPYHMDQHTRSSCIEIIDSGFYFEKTLLLYTVYTFREEMITGYFGSKIQIVLVRMNN